MRSDYGQPLNLGTDQIITINDLARMVIRHLGQAATSASATSPGRRACAAATRTTRRLREVLGWEPAIMLEEGMVPTYEWIDAQASTAGRRAAWQTPLAAAAG